MLTRRAVPRLTVRQSGSSQNELSNLASTLTWWTTTRTWTTSLAKALSPRPGDVPQDPGSVQTLCHLMVSLETYQMMKSDIGSPAQIGAHLANENLRRVLWRRLRPVSWLPWPTALSRGTSKAPNQLTKSGSISRRTALQRMSGIWVA